MRRKVIPQLDISIGSLLNFRIELSVVHDGIRVVFNCKTTSPVPSVHKPAESESPAIHPDEPLSPTTEVILKDCPR